MSKPTQTHRYLAVDDIILTAIAAVVLALTAAALLAIALPLVLGVSAATTFLICLILGGFTGVSAFIVKVQSQPVHLFAIRGEIAPTEVSA